MKNKGVKALKTIEKKESGLFSSLDLKSAGYKTAYGIIVLLMLAVAVISVFPVLWVLMSAFKGLDEFLQVPPTIIPRSFHPEKIIKVWNEVSFGKYYVNSVILIIGDVIFSVVINGVAGYVLSRINPKGSRIVFVLIFWTMLIPKTANLIPLFMSFVQIPHTSINITNTYLPMWLMAGANAFNVLLFKNYFSNIPMAYIEAARIDGCSTLGIFARIIAPMSKPIIAVVTIFSVQAAWGQFFWPYLVISDQEKYPVSVILYKLQEADLSVDIYMMVMLFAILPVLVLFTLFSKYIVDGANMSGVKG